MTTNETTRARLSNGHICLAFDGSVEFYEQGGEVFRAPTSNGFDLDGYRQGRWECSRAHFERYREVVTGQAPTRVVDLGNNETATTGVVKQQDGTFLALTFTRSKSFKREHSAWAWYRAAMGFAS